jgi:hypothetical protein
MYSDATRCFDECNNRECLHNNFNCNRVSRYDKCQTTQDAAADTSGLTDIPIHDAKTQTTTGSVADGALAPLSLGIDMHDMVLSINSVTNRMEASFGFALVMQWQDSRVATSPCAMVYPDILQLTGTSNAEQTSRANTLLGLFWNADSELSILAADRKTPATVAYDVKNFSYASNTTWLAGSGPAGYPSCTACITMVYTGSATVAQLNPEWKVKR